MATVFKYGRKDRRFDPRIPHYSSLLQMKGIVSAASSPIPASHDWASKMPNSLGYLLNDQLGDCTCAATLHAKQVWSFNVDPTMATVVDSEALWEYENWAGYVNGDPSTDNGADEQTILTDWLKQGILLSDGTHDHLTAFVELDVRNLNDVRRAIYESGLVYIGFNVPQSIENDMQAGGVPNLWEVVPGQEQPVGGHAIALTGYDATSFNLISWGAKYKMTTEFFETFTDEVYSLVDADWVSKTGMTPLGLSLQTLDDQMSALRS